MSASVLVDPAIPAFMGIATAHDEVGAAIELVGELTKTLNDFECVTAIGPRNFELALYESGCFPFYQTLGPVLTASGWGGVYDTGDVLLMINGLVQRVASISGFTAADDILLNSIQVAPSQAHLCAHPVLNEALEDMFGFYCCAALEEQQWITTSSIALNVCSGSSTEVTVDCDVGLVEPPIGANAATSFQRVEQLQRITSRCDLYSRVDPQELWRLAQTDSELKLAIAAKAHQMRVASGLPADADVVTEFVIGAHFLESLAGAQAAHAAPYAMSVLETCARIIAGLPQPDTNPFQTAAGSGVQVLRLRDGATGWRVHVSKHGIGVRLMYWRLPNGHVEFSNAAPKDDTVIYE